MPLISLTRLRLASVRHLPAFAWHAMRSLSQARRSPGFLGVRLLADRRLTFWTATAWDDLASMKAFRPASAHKAIMPQLARWCDEASVTRWVGAGGWTRPTVLGRITASPYSAAWPAHFIVVQPERRWLGF